MFDPSSNSQGCTMVLLNVLQRFGVRCRGKGEGVGIKGFRSPI